MSHFTVLVIGENPEALLEPYSESIRLPKYVRCLVTDEDKQRFVQYYCKEDDSLVPDFDQLYEEHGKDWNSGNWRKDVDGVWKEYSTYNPKSKWDWYTLGGRWHGMLKLKPGFKGSLGKSGAFDNESLGGVDQCRLEAIDFELMQNEAAEKAAKEYDEIHAIIAGRDIPRWKEDYVDKFEEINEARDAYGKHPVIIDYCKKNVFVDIEDFAVTRDEYIEKARKGAFMTFAVVTEDGTWYERGEMGWWACVSNEKEDGEWEEEFYKLVMGLDPKTLVSLYDCHI